MEILAELKKHIEKTGLSNELIRYFILNQLKNKDTLHIQSELTAIEKNMNTSIIHLFNFSFEQKITYIEQLNLTEHCKELILKTLQCRQTKAEAIKSKHYEYAADMRDLELNLIKQFQQELHENELRNVLKLKTYTLEERVLVTELLQLFSSESKNHQLLWHF